VLPLILWIILYIVKLWMQGPTKGSNAKVWLDGKVVVITGSNSGIGKITAHELSKKGARVIMLCRNLESAHSVAKEITKDTGHQVDVIKMNLASLQSVKDAANELLQKEDKIDILINNAGVMACPELKTEDGFEMQIGTNHLGHFLLTEMLLPLLKKSKASGFTPRIVIVSSVAHEGRKINWEDIHYQNKPGSYKPFLSYGQSKLANVLHAKELSRRVEKDGIHVYSLHPGVIATELWNHMKKWGMLTKILMIPFQYIMKTPFHGAQTTLYCAIHPAVEKDTGLYYADCDKKTPSLNALNEEDQKRFWNVSEKAVGIEETSDEDAPLLIEKTPAQSNEECGT